MSVITIPYNFTPRSYQLPFFDAMDSGYRRAVLVWHRRSGKDKTFVNFLAAEMQKRVGLYAYLFPTYKQGRKVLWNGMDKEGFKFMDHFPEPLRISTNNTEMHVKMKNGSIFQIFGTDDIDAFMGANPVGCVFSEYSLQIEGAWDFVRPILRENDGWAVFNFTPRGRNHAYKLANMARGNKKWFFQLLTVDDTKRPDGKPVITKDMIQEEREEGMSEAKIEQEYYCSFEAAMDTCFFSDVMDRHDGFSNGVRGDLNTFKLDWEGEESIEEPILFVKNSKSGILEIWDMPYKVAEDWDNLTWTKRYAIGSDIAEGLGQDYSVAYVLDRVTGNFVARMRSNQIDSHTWGDFLHQLSLFYDNAIIVPERTGAGITTCKRLWDLRANVYYNMVAAKAGKTFTRMVGWVETKQAKYSMAGDLREHLRQCAESVKDAMLIQECSVFVIKENKKIEAEEGFNDDCVIAAGLALQGSFSLTESPKQVGHRAIEEKKFKKKIEKLDNVSQAAAGEYAGLMRSIKDAQEYIEAAFIFGGF